MRDCLDSGLPLAGPETKRAAGTGCSGPQLRLVLAFLPALTILPLAEVGVMPATACPKDMFLAAGRCVYHNSCSDGRAYLHGRCLEICWDTSVPGVDGCPGIDRAAIDQNGGTPLDEMQCAGEVILASNKTDTRTVLLNGDKAANLIDQYFHHLDAMNLTVDVHKLKVILSCDGRLTAIDFPGLSMADFFLALSPKRKWSRFLQKFQSSRFSEAQDIAEREDFDLVCGRPE